MKAQEFYDKHKGKYFTYDGEKVRVVGFERYSDFIIVSGYGDKSSFIKNSSSVIMEEYASISDVFHRCSIYEKPFCQFINSDETEIHPCIESTTEPISKRFHAACCAMQGLLANTGPNISTESIIDIASLSLIIADELLKQENDGKALQ